MRSLACLLAASLAAACARPKPIVYAPQQPVEPDGSGGGDTSTSKPESGGGGTATDEEHSRPPKEDKPPPVKPAPANAQRAEFPVAMRPSGMVLHHHTLVWTDMAGAIWTMPGDGASKPKKLSDQHKDGLASHPFIAGDKVFAKADKELLSIDVPDGPVAKLHVTGLPGKPEDLVGDAKAIYVTVFGKPQVYRIPIGGGAAKHLVDVPRGLLALNGDTLYIASYQTGVLVAVPTSGGAQRTIAKGLKNPTALAVDDNAAYVYTEGDSKVQRIELGTGKSSVLADHFNNSDEIELSGNTIYTVNWPNNVERLGNTAGGSPTTVASDLLKPNSIVSDDRWIWVTTDEPPRIVRLAK